MPKQALGDISVWKSHYIILFYVDVITKPCAKLNSGLVYADKRSIGTPDLSAEIRQDMKRNHPPSACKIIIESMGRCIKQYAVKPVCNDNLYYKIHYLCNSGMCFD